MLQLKEGQKVRVWDPKAVPNIKDTMEANLSTAKKQKKDGKDEWKYYSWRAKFVGDAWLKAQGLEDNMLIELKSAAIENYYDKDKEKLYVTVIVFDFEPIVAEAKE